MKTQIKIASDIKEVITFTSPLASRFGFEMDEPNEANWSTRCHGSVYHESAGKEDIQAARSVIKEVQSAFSNIRGSVDTCDEWTHIIIEITPPTR